MRLFQLLRNGAGVLVVAALAKAATTATSLPEVPLSWGDQGNGTYRNPVLFADYSDPDLISVGEDFYLVASDFHFMGIQILHSRDLVNWRLAGQLSRELKIDPKYDEMRAYAEGTWAPSLRFHKGRFYLYVCTPHDGLFRWDAEKPEGPWTLTTIKRVDRWEDPCPFWDDDGSAYLVHSVHGAGPLILHKMSADGTQLLDDGVEIYRGPVAEGPKLFKRHGWYYISLPEGGVEKGGQTVLRSRSLYGPYERREVLPAGSPHQGGIVELPNGEAWFIGFRSTGAFGRVAHLLPIHWGDDDWPVFGDEGKTVTEGRKPTLPLSPLSHPQRSDDFDNRELSLAWQWNHNPVADAWSLGDRPGWLRLKGLPAETLLTARNTVTQKIWGPAGVVTVRLDTSELSDGQSAGLAFMSGKIFDTISVKRVGEKWFVSAGSAEATELETKVAYLRGNYEGENARLWLSADGKTFRPLGSAVRLKFGQWKGARIALFCFGPGGGWADFDRFDYDVLPAAESPHR